MTALFIALILVAILAWLVFWFGGRWSEQKLREMRDAFAFLGDYGMCCVREKDEGIGATVEYRGAELWLTIYCDRGDYSWQYGLVDRPEYHFEPQDFCPTLAQAQQFEGKSVRAIGELTRQNFSHFVAAIRSEKASEIVQRRKTKAAHELRNLLEDGR
jgi:hypothetical protein